MLYPEYELNLAVPQFPMRLERDWTERAAGLRQIVQSLNEFQLWTETQIKERAEMGRGWRFGVRYDRLQTRLARSDLVRVDFSWLPGDRAPYLTFSLFPRFTKIDTDLEITAGWRDDRWGDARLRLYLLDFGTNAAFALARWRGKALDVTMHQDDLPLAASAEASFRLFHGVRGEVYLGGIVPHATHYELEDDTLSFDQDTSGFLAGALVEWRVPRVPFSLRLGATALAVMTTSERTHEQSPALDRTIDEDTTELRLYALAAPRRDLNLEVQARRRGRPETQDWPGDPTMDIDHEDTEWFLSARAEWMIARNVGADLGIIHLERETEGPPDVFVDGSKHRAITRCVLRMGKVWAAFGASWDLANPDKGWFGGGSLSLMVELP
jgi:hypothetical protein